MKFDRIGDQLQTYDVSHFVGSITFIQWHQFFAIIARIEVQNVVFDLLD
jgi:hypothetical protein